MINRLKLCMANSFQYGVVIVIWKIIFKHLQISKNILCMNTTIKNIILELDLGVYFAYACHVNMCFLRIWIIPPTHVNHHKFSWSPQDNFPHTSFAFSKNKRNKEAWEKRSNFVPSIAPFLFSEPILRTVIKWQTNQRSVEENKRLRS